MGLQEIGSATVAFNVLLCRTTLHNTARGTVRRETHRLYTGVLYFHSVILSKYTCIRNSADAHNKSAAIRPASIFTEFTNKPPRCVQIFFFPPEFILILTAGVLGRRVNTESVKRN